MWSIALLNLFFVFVVLISDVHYLPLCSIDSLNLSISFPIMPSFLTYKDLSMYFHPRSDPFVLNRLLRISTYYISILHLSRYELTKVERVDTSYFSGTNTTFKKNSTEPTLSKSSDRPVYCRSCNIRSHSVYSLSFGNSYIKEEVSFNFVYSSRVHSPCESNLPRRAYLRFKFGCSSRLFDGAWKSAIFTFCSSILSTAFWAPTLCTLSLERFLVSGYTAASQ